MYELIQWPEVQELMNEPDFRENACLANDDFFVEQYGSSAYFVNVDWLAKIATKN